jgi:hypothetical protein
MPRPQRLRKGERQRFYARNAVKTTLDRAFGRLVRSFWAIRSNALRSTRIHPALSSFADECCATLARLLAYVGTLALLAIVGIHLWDQLPAGEASEPPLQAGWSVASRSHPAFAVNQLDSPDKTEAYRILRHPEGGRKDIFRWTARDGRRGERPVAELEIDRPDGEFDRSGPAAAGLAARMPPEADTNSKRPGLPTANSAR